MKPNKSSWILFLGLIGLSLVSPVVGQENAVRLGEWFLQVRPALEKTLGYPLPKAPLFQGGTFQGVPDPDIAAHLRWRFPHLRDEALAPALADAQAVNNAASLARLIEGTNVILVRPENQQAIAGWDKSLRAAASPDFFKLAVLHETVRYALDTRYDLARRRRACRDGEEWFALQALVDGRAQEVTRRLADQLGLAKSFSLLAERFNHVPDVSPDPGLGNASI